MRLEIICTGDEVLTGKIVNTNFSYMSQKLEDVGLAVQWETTVGDDRENLLRAFTLAAERADAVIVNGGLGPTVDDLSQEIAAKAAGVELALNEDWLHRMEDSSAPRAVDAAQQSQAGDAADDGGGDRQPDRHACGFALTSAGAVLYAGRTARAAADARGADHPAAPRQSGVQTAIHLKHFPLQAPASRTSTRCSPA
jgi:nicotinamide-nucleotide amidase